MLAANLLQAQRTPFVVYFVNRRNLDGIILMQLATAVYKVRSYADVSCKY